MIYSNTPQNTYAQLDKSCRKRRLSMTQTAKTVSRKVAIALGILCVATLVALNFSIITYYSEMNNKNTQIQTLNEQIVSLQTQIAKGTLPAPKLSGIGMQYIDNRTDISAPFLEVTGYICNVGTSIANNCILHVSALRNDNSIGVDSSANIESLQAGNYTKVDLQFPYHGTPLINFTSNLEWGN
jgi:cell division protein FtsL